MIKRIFLPLTVAAIVFAATVFQIHKEAIAETANTEIEIKILSTDGELHGSYNVSLINITKQIVAGSLNQKIGSYPSIHGGNFPYSNDKDWFVIQGCSNQGWGFLQSTPFQMVEGGYLRFEVTAGRNCPQYPFKHE